MSKEQPKATVEFEGKVQEVPLGVSQSRSSRSTAGKRGGRVSPQGTSGEDKVTEASEQSFPASDAPSYNP